MKIISLGTSGCGKTVYLAGVLHNLFFNTTTEFSLNEIDMANLTLDFSLLQDIHNNIYVNRKFPSGTSSTGTFSFNFAYNNTHIGEKIQIHYTDPIGGDFYLLNKGDKAAIDRTYSRLRDTDAILIFVDSIKLMENTSIEEVRMNVIEQVITRLVRHICECINKHVKVYFIISKTDSEQTSGYTKLEIEEKLRLVFHNLYSRISYSIPVYCVSAVGKGNVVTNSVGNQEIIPTRELTTYNIAKSFLFIIKNYLQDVISENCSIIKDKSREINQLQNEYYKHSMKKFIDHAFQHSKTDFSIRERMEELEELRQHNTRYELMANLLDQQYRTTIY